MPRRVCLEGRCCGWPELTGESAQWTGVDSRPALTRQVWHGQTHTAETKPPLSQVNFYRFVSETFQCLQHTTPYVPYKEKQPIQLKSLSEKPHKGSFARHQHYIQYDTDKGKHVSVMNGNEKNKTSVCTIYGHEWLIIIHQNVNVSQKWFETVKCDKPPECRWSCDTHSQFTNDEWNATKKFLVMFYTHLKLLNWSCISINWLHYCCYKKLLLLFKPAVL